MVKIGNKYNLLTVIAESQKRGKNGTKYWICQCDCGTIKEIRGDKLQSGHTKSCGCLNSKARISNIAGNKYGLLTPIYPTDMRASGGDVIWLCQCDCGGTVYATKSELVNNRRKTCGCIRSNGELAIKELLDNNNICYKREYIFTNLKDQGYLRFDFGILKDNKLQYLIEYDGEFHYKFKNNNEWYGHLDSKIIKKHDEIKNNYCIQNNIPLIRIPYWHLEQLCLEDLLLETSKYIIKD